MQRVYNENKDFKAYVDRYCANQGKTVEQALKEVIIKEVAKSYQAGGCNYSGNIKQAN